MRQNPIYLLVDDDTDDIEFFCEALQDINEKAKCFIARNGEEAISILRNMTDIKPDLIVLDLNMPKMNGKSCLRKLKSDNELKDIPVVVYTTSANRMEKDETLLLGAAEFMTKATSFSKLCADILEIIKKISKISNRNVLA